MPSARTGYVRILGEYGSVSCDFSTAILLISHSVVEARIFVYLVEFDEKSQNLSNLKLKRKIVKFAKFVTAFSPGHKWERTREKMQRSSKEQPEKNKERISYRKDRIGLVAFDYLSMFRRRTFPFLISGSLRSLPFAIGSVTIADFILLWTLPS